MSEPQTTNEPTDIAATEQAGTDEKLEPTKKKPGDPYIKDYDGNEITTRGKIVAGFCLALLTFFGCFFIVCYWPDRLPTPNERIAPLYINDPFHVRLACLRDTCCPDSIDLYTTAPVASTAPAASDAKTSATTTVSTIPTSSATTTTSATPTSSASTTSTAITTASPTGTAATTTTTTASTRTDVTPVIESNKVKRSYRRDELLHINTLLLILVGLGGFVGNMIHVATSFTTFVGAGKFKKSWLLWYCIKPFTAAALAIGIYFVFRGGFLNMSDAGASINLYGLMTISLFAGLFTDKATEKLKEVFEVLFRSKEERPDPLVSKFKIVNISPLIIEKDKVNKMTLTGEKLDTEKLKISINSAEIIDIKTSASTITFNYTIPDTQKDRKTLTVSVKDDKGKEHYTVDLTVKEPDAPVPVDTKPGEPKPGTPVPGPGDTKPGESKPETPTPGNKPVTEEKEGSTTATTKPPETKTDPSASNDDDDDADRVAETGQPIIKG